MSAPRWEWQIATGSSTAHVVDADRPWPAHGEPGWRSGPRALCKRYPQRNAEDPWFGLSVSEPDVAGAIRRYMSKQCPDCLTLLEATT